MTYSRRLDQREKPDNQRGNVTMLFTATIYQSWGSSSNRDNWVNTMEYETDTPLEDAGHVQFANLIAATIRPILLTPVLISRITIRTYSPEVAPNNINNLRTIPINLTGARNPPAADPFDLNFALVVNRGVKLGRAGRLLLRGCLNETDVTFGSGGATMLTGDYRGAHAFVNTNWITQFTSIPEFVPVMARTMGAGTPGAAIAISEINSFSLNGVSIVKRNHKWFNRKKAA